MPTFKKMEEQLPGLETQEALAEWILDLGKLPDCPVKEELQVAYFIRLEEVSQALAPSADTAEAKQRQVGDLKHLSDEMGGYSSAELKHAFGELTNNYPGFRQVRGDGNCYFRAVIYSLIEQAIASPGRAALFEEIAKKTEALIGFGNSIYDEELRGVTALLWQAGRGDIWPTLHELETDMRNIHSKTDALLMRAGRVLTVVNVENDPDSRDSYLSKDRAEILQMGREADGSFVQKGNLFNALGISGSLVRVETKGEAIANLEGARNPLPRGAVEIHLLNPGDNPLNPPIDVNILLKPGHYDMFYSEKQFNTMSQFQETGKPVLGSAYIKPESLGEALEDPSIKHYFSVLMIHIKKSDSTAVIDASMTDFLNATKRLHVDYQVAILNAAVSNKEINRNPSNSDRLREQLAILSPAAAEDASAEEHKEQVSPGEATAIAAIKPLYKAFSVNIKNEAARNAFLEGAAKHPLYERAILSDAATKLAKVQLPNMKPNNILNFLEKYALKHKGAAQDPQVADQFIGNAGPGIKASVAATQAMKGTLEKFKDEQPTPSGVAISLLEELMEDIVHHQDKIEESMKCFLSAVPENSEEKLDFLTTAIDVLNSKKESLAKEEGYSEGSTVIKRIEAQSKVLGNEVNKALDPPNQLN